MHQAQRYIDLHIRPSSPNVPLQHITLSAPQSAALRQALAVDAVDYAYSGSISIADAVQAIERSLYTWATVKLYYSVFYLARALLASQHTAIFYDGTKPYSWQCAAGALPVKRNGPTHKAVLTTFADVLPSSPILSQPVGAVEALNWLMARREEVNYSNPRFSEPNPPAHLAAVARIGVRKSLSAYINDKTYLYAFDPEHAMLALPLEALKFATKELRGSGLNFPNGSEESRYMCTLFFDRTGPLAEIASILRV